MNVGIVGYGWVAGAHIDALNSIDGIEVTAVYSSRSQDENELSKKHGSSIKAFQDLGEMLSSDDIEVISICSYPGQHKEHAIAAARAGKHLILEKPLALSIEDCSEIRSAVLEANVRTCVCFECRYSSQFLATKSVIDDGLLGKIHYGKWIIIMVLDHGMDSFVGTPEKSTEEVVYFRLDVMHLMRCSFVWEVMLRRLVHMLRFQEALLFLITNIPRPRPL